MAACLFAFWFNISIQLLLAFFSNRVFFCFINLYADFSEVYAICALSDVFIGIFVVFVVCRNWGEIIFRKYTMLMHGTTYQIKWNLSFDLKGFLAPESLVHNQP